MKFCKNCGKQINENTAFCPYCGQKTMAEQPPIPAAQQKEEPKSIPIDPLVASAASVQPNQASAVSPKKEKKTGGALPVILLAALFVIGMLVEILVNTPIQQIIYNPFNIPWSEIRRTVFLQTVQSFGNETIPLYAVPSLLMNLMIFSARTRIGAILRWIPYLVLFFIPVLSAMVRKKGIPLLVSGVITLFEGVGVLITAAVSDIGGRYLNVMNGIPFILEALFVILLAVAFFTKKKGLCIVAGILSATFAVVSIFLTPTLRFMNAAMRSSDVFLQSLRMVISRPRTLYVNAAGSFWPVYKTFVLLMFALLAFLSAGKLKREKKQRN